jgi:two-component system chemotaxis response regulator CheY
MEDKKIMIVDDAAFMRMMIKNSLTSQGYTNLIEAADGKEALDTYNAQKPDLVIMDITMPNMDGLQALQAIKAADPGAKVVMCSAMGQESMVVDAIRFGALDFIVKPFKPDRILQTVEKILG